MKNETGRIDLPIVLAICGKSATGKDSLAKWLTIKLESIGIPAHRMISATTRAPRNKESFDDYYFMSDDFFDNCLTDEQLLEWTTFRGWKYGTLKREVQKGKINIGVFNVDGLKTLNRWKYQYKIVPIYLEEDFQERMRRSHNREGK